MAEGGEGESVQVAVRMRLFNGRERNANATRVVRMTQEQVGSKTFIVNPDTGAEKSFAFDYSFQSHSETEQGIGEYATQDTVFNLLGKPVLYCALEGRNVCLFAYGQTGAGKSFSMLGKTDDPKQQGIIPRSCREIFRLRDEERDDALVSYKISIQVVEVYCEMINDLLEVRSKWPQTGHKPRLTKDGYVVDTVTRPCGCYDDIEQAFLIADKNRSVGSHALNPESSRAHTIYTINYQRQKKLTADAKQAETISAKINLVDLAGSERSESAGTTGQMLKEGNAINLSLTALGSTIKALSEGKRPNFRDSKLTLLLQGSMTNGKVIMIAAVSPASICFDESMSTLRFAERIKMVKIKAKKNVTQDPVAEIKKEMEEMRTKMQEEIDLLKAQSEGKSLPPNEAAAELAKMLADQEESEKQLKVDFEKRLASIEAGGDDEEAQKRERDAQDAEWANELGDMRRVSEVTEPHLRNLNSEARLAETLFYAFKKGTTRIGRRNKESPPDIEFNGMGIKHDHCVAEWDAEANTVSLTNSNGGSTTTVNGKRVVGTVQLVHNCRVWLGNNYAFRFVYPGQEAQGEAFEAPPDYFFAEAEICEQSAGIGGLPEKLGHQLSEALKKVEQANIIATDLKQPCSYLPRIIKNRVSGEDNVVVQVQLQHATYVWPWEKFLLRLSSMVVKWQEWQTASEQGEPPALPWAYPFDDNEPQLIGEADVWMQSLGNMIEHEADASLLAPIGEPEGRIHLAIKPLDRNGNEGPWEDEDDDLDPFVDNPEDLLDKEIGFVVRIKKLVFDVNLQFGHCKWEQVWVRYKLDLMDENEEWSKTEETTGSTFNPTFTYVKKHKKIADRDFIDSLGKKRIVFQVWGHMIDYEDMATKKAGAGTAAANPAGRNKLAQDLTYSIDLLQAGAPKLPDQWNKTTKERKKKKEERQGEQKSRQQSMAHIRAICTDVDGTLLGPSHELRDDTREALQAAVARGIKVVLCTGRGGGKWITDIREQVGGGNSIGAPAVLRHGRLVIGTDEVLLRRTTVQNEVVQALKPIMPERMIAHSVCGQTFARTYHQEVRDTIAPFGDHYWTVVGDTVFDSIGAEAAAAGTEAVEAYGLEYVLVGLDDAVIASVRAQVEAAVAHLDVVTLSAVKGFIEITAGAKVSKASALQEVLPLVGVEAREVIALGDGENDLEMLAMVRDAGGISVAMGNAVPAVKECAEHQTTANSEGGWHRALQEHVLAAPRVAES